jgi:DNA (cytosine-5)-methyltransferase 1
MKIGTDFSGIGSPEMALKLLGIEHEIEFACEIDKYARKSYEAIYGKPKRFYNDITKRDYSEVPQLDLYVAGFPCQAFSMAGKRLGFEEARGTLFFNVAEFIKENQPKMFILENVKGLLSHDNGKTFSTITSILSDNGGTINGQTQIPYFDDGLGYHIYHQVLNTKDFGIPQNRERIFIVGFKEFREFSFPAPFSLELRLKDILEDEVDDKYFLSDKMIETMIRHNIESDKDICNSALDSNYYKGFGVRGSKGRCTINVKSATSKGYEEATDGDSINYSVPNSKTRRGRVGKGVDQTLDTQCNQAIVKEQIRRLTPLECWRLQAYPDDSFFKAQEVNSDTQLYKQAGNSISVNVMIKIIEKCLKKK